MNQETAKTYRSTFDPFTLGITLLLSAAISIALFFLVSSYLVAVIAFLAGLVLFYVTQRSLKYQLSGHHLLVSSLFSDQKIDTFQISSLRWVKGATDLKSIYGLSRKRLQVIYGYGQFIDIAPKNSAGFIDSLLSINPMIQYHQSTVF